MSMKLYNGYFLPHVQTLTEAHQLLMAFATQARRRKAIGVITAFSKTAATIFDDRTEPQTTSALEEARAELGKDRSERIQKGLRGSPYDFGCSLSFAPVPKGKGTLVLLYTEQEELRTLWRTFAPDICSFGYWNNEDPPTDISEQAWHERASLWNALFKLGATPAECMFSFEACSSDPYLDTDFSDTNVVHFIPSFEERVQRIARQEQIALKVASYPEPISMGTWSEILWNTRKAPSQDIQKAVRKRLKPDLTIEDLRHKVAS